jgi:acetate kinase
VTDAHLVINAGSSSLKFALYAAADAGLLCRGTIDGMGRGAGFSPSGPRAEALAAAPALPGDESHAAMIDWLVTVLKTRLPDLTIRAAGHRIVHGGPHFDKPVLIDEPTLDALALLVPLAPAHQPHNLAAVRAVAASWPGLPQIACFDTAFHRTQPRLAQLFAIPRALTDEGILRYGFHGLSYTFIAGQLGPVAGLAPDARVVAAHLGHGASLCAMRNGASIGTTMGFTAVDGLMMGKRTGTIDPGVLLHLMREKGYALADVDRLINSQSGLLGVSGISDDVRDLEASEAPAAAEALDLFAYRAARELGSLIAALGGIDALVFTAGIGEHSAAMRRRIVERSAWTGMVLDDSANKRNATRISTPASKVGVFVIPTDEEVVIARGIAEVLGR